MQTLTAAFIGNCQGETLQRAFQRATTSLGFSSSYHYFDVPESRHEEVRARLSDCNVVLMQDIQDLEFHPLRDAIPASTKIIPFPFLRFASPWPYDDFNGMRDAVARAQDDPGQHTTTYYDGVLGRLRRSIPEPKARFEAYKAANAKCMVDPLRVHDFERRRLEQLDARFGCSIGRFILDEFRRSRLFYTVNRPCGALLARVLDYIFRTIGIEIRAEANDTLDALRSIETPVHPFVARRLGLTWADENTLYSVSGRTASWEAFVRGYIENYG